MVYTLEQLRQKTPVQFPEGNKIGFWMDFCFWKGIPSDRTFYITGDAPEQHKSFYLAADGYGVRGSYGNGSIMVRKVNVLCHQQRPKL